MNVKSVISVLSKCGDFSKLSVSKLQKAITTIESILGHPLPKPDLVQLSKATAKELWRHFFNQSQSLVNDVDSTSLECELGQEPNETVVLGLCRRLVELTYHRRFAMLQKSREAQNMVVDL
jgi:hypothetical protein